MQYLNQFFFTVTNHYINSWCTLCYASCRARRLDSKGYYISPHTRRNSCWFSCWNLCKSRANFRRGFLLHLVLHPVSSLKSYPQVMHKLSTEGHRGRGSTRVVGGGSYL